MKTAVVNDAALRPPTTMAPPVPVKKKISIPSVFLVDDKQQRLYGNGSVMVGGAPATYVRTMDRPPPRPVRPPPVTGSGLAGGSAQLKCNTLNLSSSHRSSSPASPPQPSLAGNSVPSNSQYLLMSSSPKQQQQQVPQPHPPPRRRDQVGQSYGTSSPAAASTPGRGTELQSKCLSVKVMLSPLCFP